MIEHLCHEAVKVMRMQDLGSDLMAFSTVTTAMVHIQPQMSSKRMLEGTSGGVFGKQFKIYTDVGRNFQQGDRIRDTNNNYYTVVADGETDRSFGSISFKILLVEKTR